MPEADRSKPPTPPATLALREAVAKADKARRDWEEFYQAELLVALGVSFGVGIFLGWLVKRR